MTIHIRNKNQRDDNLTPSLALLFRLSATALAAAAASTRTALVVPRLLRLLLLLVLQQLLAPDFLLPLLGEMPLEVAAMRNGACVGPKRALACVHLNQAKNAAANFAPTANAHRARAAVVQQLLHFSASYKIAFVVFA